MKKLSYILFFLGVVTNSLGQSRETELEKLIPESKTNLTFKLGSGIPTANFSKTDRNNEQSGYALPGLLFEIDLSHHITETVYLSFMGRFQYNGLDEDEFINIYRSLVPSNVVIVFESEAWKTNSFMGGLGTKTYLDDKTDFVTRFMIGASSFKSPSFSAELSDRATTVVESQESGSTSAFSYLIGAGLRLKAKKGISVLIAADYFASTPDFSNVKFVGTVNGTTVVNQSLSFEQEIRLINLSIGLSIPL